MGTLIITALYPVLGICITAIGGFLTPKVIKFI